MKRQEAGGGPAKKVNYEPTDEETGRELIDSKMNCFSPALPTATGRLENPYGFVGPSQLCSDQTIVRERELYRERGGILLSQARMDRGVDMAERKQRKIRTGRVVSDKMDKTVVVGRETWMRHPL